MDKRLCTIAFGGVATGSMKAIEQDMVVGIMNSRGFWLRETARTASTGSRMLAVAVFEVTSVRNVTTKHIRATKPIGGKSAKTTN